MINYDDSDVKSRGFFQNRDAAVFCLNCRDSWNSLSSEERFEVLQFLSWSFDPDCWFVDTNVSFDDVKELCDEE